MSMLGSEILERGILYYGELATVIVDYDASPPDSSILVARKEFLQFNHA